MRIALICQQSEHRYDIPAYAFWREYLRNGILEAGHECVEIPNVDWAEGLTCREASTLTNWLDRVWTQTVEFANGMHSERGIDFVLSYLYPHQVDTSAIVEIRRFGVPCVNFFCDNVREFRDVPREFACFDLHWVPELAALEMYRRAGLAHVHAPMPCWIPVEFRSPPARETEPPTFIGSADPLRRDLFGRALSSGAEFVLRGAGWNGTADNPANSSVAPRTTGKTLMNQVETIRTKGLLALGWKIINHASRRRTVPIPAVALREGVTDSEYFRISREAVVTIGANRVATPYRFDQRPVTYSRLRDIEAPMLGACYLTEFAPGLDSLYDIGSEIEVYRGPDELAHKLADLRGDNARRGSMRRRAQQRALAHYTIPRSLERVTKQLGLRQT